MKAFIPICLAILCLTAFAADRELGGYRDNDHQEGDERRDRDDHQEGDDRYDRDDHQEGDDRHDRDDHQEGDDNRNEYQRLSPKEVENNRQAKAALEFGANKVIVKAIFKGDIRKGEYCVTAILYAARQRLSNGTNYRFIVEISNKKGELVLIAKFRVFVSRNGQKYLRFSSIDIIKEGKRGKYDKYDRYD